ncbi:MAG: T9SS type A sorting domain-containing protein, partial [Muribaculaceae bacterium]|nr:T9SS type A sorting domain-containing protein [Muribaculaceae bacterium]
GIVACDNSHFSDDPYSAMYIDEANGYLYLFSTMTEKYGLYRIALSSISDSGDSYFVNNTAWELIDDSPASPENNTTSEGVHVRQITGDGNYIYWSYIAEEGSGLKSGIKMIPATGTPTVSYLSEDIEVYGLAVKDFDPAGMEQIALDGTSPGIINVAGKSISASGDVTVTVYSISGAVELSVEVAAGGSVALDGLGNGMYIIRATAADGTTQAVKAVI